MKKLFLSDVDHTLVAEDRKFSKEIIEAIKLVLDNGDVFVLCSGRPTNSLKKSADYLKTQGAELKYVSGYNGAQVMDLTNNSIVIDHGFNLEETTLLANYLDELGLDYALYDEKYFYVTDIESEYAKVEQDIINYEMKQLKEICASAKILVFVNPEENEKYRKQLAEKLPQFTYEYSQPFFIEVTKKGISKATALKNISELEGIKYENTYGFGDGGNDIELIKQANTGVVVDNAKDEIKQYAQEVTNSVYENGVAKYINKIYN